MCIHAQLPKIFAVVGVRSEETSTYLSWMVLRGRKMQTLRQAFLPCDNSFMFVTICNLRLCPRKKNTPFHSLSSLLVFIMLIFSRYLAQHLQGKAEFFFFEKSKPKMLFSKNSLWHKLKLFCSTLICSVRMPCWQVSKTVARPQRVKEGLQSLHRARWEVRIYTHTAAFKGLKINVVQLIPQNLKNNHIIFFVAGQNPLSIPAMIFHSSLGNIFTKDFVVCSKMTCTYWSCLVRSMSAALCSICSTRRHGSFSQHCPSYMGD